MFDVQFKAVVTYYIYFCRTVNKPLLNSRVIV